MPETAITAGIYAGYGAATVGTIAGAQAISSGEGPGKVAQAIGTGSLKGAVGGAAVGAGGAALGAAGITGSQMVAAAGTAVGGALPQILAKKPAAINIPGLPPPAVMPDPVAQQAAQQRSIAQLLALRGRASTIMTASSDTLGA
jgi:hypothetical protein